MYIDYDRLAGAGYDVQPSKKGLTITAIKPLDLPWESLRDLCTQAGLTGFEVDSGFDAFVGEVEMIQIMKACKG